MSGGISVTMSIVFSIVCSNTRVNSSVASASVTVRRVSCPSLEKVSNRLATSAPRPTAPSPTST